MTVTAAGGPAESERRRFKRAHFLFKGEVLTGGRAVGGHVLDLSINGARFRFKEGSEDNAKMTLPGGGATSPD
jgi:hypothetical protein